MAVYVRQDLSVVDISPDIDDVVVIQTKLSNGLSLTIAAVYYAPGTNKSTRFCPTILNTLHSLIRQHKSLIILGDLNAKHHFYGNSFTDIRGDEMFNLVET